MTKCREQDVCSFISWVFSLRWLSRKRRGILTVFGASHFSESKIQSREVHQDVPFCGRDRQQHSRSLIPVPRLANQLGTYPAIFSCWAEDTHSYWKVLGYKTK
jgi:hypothetical protein